MIKVWLFYKRVFCETQFMRQLAKQASSKLKFGFFIWLHHNDFFLIFFSPDDVQGWELVDTMLCFIFLYVPLHLFCFLVFWFCFWGFMVNYFILKIYICWDMKYLNFNPDISNIILLLKATSLKDIKAHD